VSLVLSVALPYSTALHGLGRSMRSSALLFGALFVVIVACEAVDGANLRRYLSREALNDLAYAFFYRGGIYALFVYNPFFESLRPQLAIFNLHVLSQAPLYVSGPVFLLITDLIGYWIHRLQHTRLLWPFHSVHHSQRTLTLFTFHRFHLVDQFVASLLIFIPLLLLGAPPKLWLGITFLQYFMSAMQHSELNWRLGPFYYVFAGPVFHSIHHSPDEKVLNKNFSMAFSFWDFLFGTGVDVRERCREYGVVGLHMPETLSGQFIKPFGMWFREMFARKQAKTMVVAEAQQLDNLTHVG
jgi:sterol desaturase/sphingolipid hydroxylase (fatty acid hydroxylase superfamily)